VGVADGSGERVREDEDGNCKGNRRSFGSLRMTVFGLGVLLGGVDGLVGGDGDANDSADDAAEAETDGCTGSLSFNEAIRFPCGGEDGGSCSGAYAGADDGVAETVIVFEELDGVDVLLWDALVVEGEMEHNGFVGDGGDGAGVFFGGGVGDLDFLTGLDVSDAGPCSFALGQAGSG
jgi:hypothetical protein